MEKIETPRNPYIAGNPVGGDTAFVGRADVLREVKRVLENPNESSIVLYGQRRIGKTSILQQLEEYLPAESNYIPVYFDLQDKASWPLESVLLDLAREISHNLSLPDPNDLDFSQSDLFQNSFMPQVYKHLPAGNSLVLLFDEFDVLDNPSPDQAGATFFPYLRKLMSANRQRLQFVFVIGRKPNDLDVLTLSVFKGVKAKRVSLLDREDASRLIHLSDQNGTLSWSEEAVEAIWDLTNGHPYLTQQLCEVIWNNAYDDDPDYTPTITPSDIKAAIPEALESSVHALEWLWNGLAPAERIVSSVLAKADSRPIDEVELEQLLSESGVRIVIHQLQNAPHILQEWDLIEPVNGGYRFRVELLRQWIAEKKNVRSVQQELDHIVPLAETLYQAGFSFYQRNQLEDAVNDLQRSIKINPNHLQSGLLLAQIYFEKSDLDEAVSLLETIYTYHPGAARPRLIQALLAQGNRKRSKANRRMIYERILILAPNHLEAAEKLKPIELADFQSQIEQLEEQKKYHQALETLVQLGLKYPNEGEWSSHKKYLEQKIKLDDTYQVAIESLKANNNEAAYDALTEAVYLDREHKDALQLLINLAVGIDVNVLQDEFTRIKRSKDDLETKFKNVTKQKNDLETKFKNVTKQKNDSKKISVKLSRLMILYGLVAVALLALFVYSTQTLDDFATSTFIFGFCLSPIISTFVVGFVLRNG